MIHRACRNFAGSIDGEEFEGGSATDFLLELGSDTLIEGFNEQLAGSEAGETRTVEVTFPDDYGAEHLAGEDASFEVSVKEVREKRLPDGPVPSVPVVARAYADLEGRRTQGKLLLIP